MDVDQPDDSQDKEPGPSKVRTTRKRCFETYRRAWTDVTVLQQR